MSNPSPSPTETGSPPPRSFTPRSPPPAPRPAHLPNPLGPLPLPSPPHPHTFTERLGKDFATNAIRSREHMEALVHGLRTKDLQDALGMYPAPAPWKGWRGRRIPGTGEFARARSEAADVFVSGRGRKNLVIKAGTLRVEEQQEEETREVEAVEAGLDETVSNASPTLDHVESLDQETVEIQVDGKKRQKRKKKGKAKAKADGGGGSAHRGNQGGGVVAVAASPQRRSERARETFWGRLRENAPSTPADADVPAEPSTKKDQLVTGAGHGGGALVTLIPHLSFAGGQADSEWRADVIPAIGDTDHPAALSREVVSTSSYGSEAPDNLQTPNMLDDPAVHIDVNEGPAEGDAPSTRKAHVSPRQTPTLPSPVASPPKSPTSTNSPPNTLVLQILGTPQPPPRSRSPWRPVILASSEDYCEAPTDEDDMGEDGKGETQPSSPLPLRTDLFEPGGTSDEDGPTDDAVALTPIIGSDHPAILAPVDARSLDARLLESVESTDADVEAPGVKSMVPIATVFAGLQAGSDDSADDLMTHHKLTTPISDLPSSPQPNLVEEPQVPTDPAPYLGPLAITPKGATKPLRQRVQLAGVRARPARSATNSSIRHSVAKDEEWQDDAEHSPPVIVLTRPSTPRPLSEASVCERVERNNGQESISASSDEDSVTDTDMSGTGNDINGLAVGAHVVASDASGIIAETQAEQTLPSLNAAVKDGNEIVVALSAEEILPPSPTHGATFRSATPSPPAALPLSPNVSPIPKIIPLPHPFRASFLSPIFSPKPQPLEAAHHPLVHPTHRTYTLSFSDTSAKSRARRPSAEDYSGGIVHLFAASDLEELCGKWKALRRRIAEATKRIIEPLGQPMDCRNGGLGIGFLCEDNNFHFFVEGVKPMWEDEMCKRGGKFMLAGNAAPMDNLFLEVVLLLVSGHLEDACPPFPGIGPFVVGATLSRRKINTRIEIWLGGKDDPSKEWIRAIEAEIGRRFMGMKVYGFSKFSKRE